MLIKFRPCLDSTQLSTARQQELDIPRNVAEALGKSAVEATKSGYYLLGNGTRVDWSGHIQAACSRKISIPPDAPLPKPKSISYKETIIQVTNETTLGASKRLVDSGLKPLALNFANGIRPGGGFLDGARAQEEVLCRSSALYQTLVGDRMYQSHRQRPQPDSTDWAIYSPDVPVFRRDDGKELEHPWLLSFITCAAPYAPTIGQPEAGNLLQRRIHRLLAIARAYGYHSLVLGAWGCGAFGNDIQRTARDFRSALENEFCGSFSDIVFAIADWSPERKFLEPFNRVFASSSMMELRLTDKEMQEVRAIANNSSQTIESLLNRLEQLTWRDGLLEFRMQSGSPSGLLPWMEQLLDLSNRINIRLENDGIPLGPNLKAYKSWLASQNSGMFDF